ncbi:MAG TPA: MFS transporter [Polyangiaceae bacterium]|nr:MFS transporter [Polyangiaceae bacterium]
MTPPPPSPDESERVFWLRARVFALTWVTYASYYLGRKGLSVVKTRLVMTQGIDESALALIDSAFLVAYALGLPASGMLGDRVGARRLLSAGLLVSAGACASFGLASAVGPFLLAFLLNGFAQSTGWPGTNKAMADWTPPASRGRVMGIWATCYQVGGVVATALASYLLTHRGWRAVFVVPALWLALLAAVVALSLPGAPARGEGAAAGPARPGVPRAPAEAAPAGDERRAARRALVRSPRVWSYGASYFCIKLIRYGILFWLPYYLFRVLGYPEGSAGYYSTSFEIGGVAGAIAFGVLSDRFPALSRPAWAALGLAGLALALGLYQALAARGPAFNFGLMALVGFLLFGPDALLSGAAAQELGGRHAAGTAVGLVNGVGSAGAVLQGFLLVGVSRRFGWPAVFYAFLACALLGALALAPSLRARRGRAAEA